jgi:transglutaminase-like putative cysteine protease
MRIASIPSLVAAALCLAAGTPSTLEFDARYELVVRAPEGGKHLRVWFPLPNDDPAQSISELRIDSPVPHRITRDELGNRLVYVEVDGPPRPLALAASFRVARREVRARTDPAATRPYRKEDLADKQRWLEANEHVIINDRVRQLSREIVGDQGNPVRSARAIYDWMLDHVDYWVKEPGLKSASKVGSTAWCLDTDTGNCTDFHSLYASLARAAGIPTRLIYGSLFKPELDGKPVDASYHCWIEFWVPSLGWIPLDVAVADIFHGPIEIDDRNRELVSRTTADGYSGPEPAKVDYYFGNLEPRRVTWTEGRDLRLDPPQDGGPVNALPKAYVEIDGKPLAEGDGWTRTFTYSSRKGG